MKRNVIILIILCLTVLPVFSITQNQIDICEQAKRDAAADHNPFLWLGAGIVLNWIGILIGMLVAPSPPGDRLLGKSSDYALAYTQCYGESAKSSQWINATIGCTAMVISGGIGMILFMQGF
jgi:hypothetical protein